MAGPQQELLRRISRTKAGYWVVSRVPAKIDPTLLRLTGGRFSCGYPLPVMLLTTTGNKTGLRRSSPLVYLVDGESLVVVASNFGRPGHPAWYRNMLADPAVEVLAGARSGRYRAEEITDPARRAELWARAVEVYPGYDDYVERAAGRTIPLVRLRRTPNP